MIEITERVGAEPKVIPTPIKKITPADAEMKKKEKNDDGTDSEAQKHEDDGENKENLHD